MATPKMRRKVHEKIEVAPDLEIHVTTVKAAGVTLYEVRNYVPSTKEYGRGITIPTGRPSADVVAGLVRARAEESKGTRLQGRTE